MTIEQNIQPRQPGESTADFRARISRLVSRGRDTSPLRKNPDTKPVDVWWDSVGEEGLYDGYLGWKSLKTAQISESGGMDVNFASSMMDEAEGAGKFIGALHATIGKSITMEEVMTKIKKGIKNLETEKGEQLHLKGPFLNWCVDQMEIARNLVKKAEELRQAS